MPSSVAQRIVTTCLALLLFPCLAPRLPASEATERPLTVERVVQLFVSGTPAGELILMLQQSPVDFDLTQEMVGELRAAGLPALLIENMQKRQAEIDRANAPPAEPTPAGETAPLPTLRILFNGGDQKDERRTIRLFQGVDPALAEALGLRGEAPTFTDMALFLGCRTADHVPDHWRSKSPMGRDFRLTPRHRLLAFLPGAERVEAPARLRRKGETDLAVLELLIPDQIEVELEAEIVHDLTLGIAVQSDDRYYLVASDEWDGLILEADEELRATLTDAGDLSPGSLELRFRH